MSISYPRSVEVENLGQQWFGRVSIQDFNAGFDLPVVWLAAKSLNSKNILH